MSVKNNIMAANVRGHVKRIARRWWQGVVLLDSHLLLAGLGLARALNEASLPISTTVRSIRLSAGAQALACSRDAASIRRIGVTELELAWRICFLQPALGVCVE